MIKTRFHFTFDNIENKFRNKVLMKKMIRGPKPLYIVGLYLHDTLHKAVFRLEV